jgi:hypothetical protein
MLVENHNLNVQFRLQTVCPGEASGYPQELKHKHSAGC